MLKTILFILIVFIILNKHYFYHITISNIRLLIWLFTNDYKKISNFRKEIQNTSIQDFFFNKKLGIDGNSDTPFFDKQYTFRENNILKLKDPNIFGKTDSLPSVINFFTTPFNLLGQWIGDSIFRTDLHLRGKNNFKKEQYLQALRKKNIELYQNEIKKHIPKIFTLNKEHNLLDICTKLCNDLFYLLHFGNLPNKEDFNDTQIFIKAVAKFSYTDLLNKEVRDQLFNLKFYYYKTIGKINNIKNENKKCIIKDWIDAGINENDIFIEVIHNIIGMVVNWINTIYPYLIELSKENIPRIEKGLEKEYILECFRYLMPVKFVSSKIKEPNVVNKNKGKFNAIHDLTVASKDKSWGKDSNKFNLSRVSNYQKYMTPKGKCPFYNTRENAKVPCEFSIYERDNYTPFGIGYRRCPGEIISMIFLEEIAFFFKDKKINVYLKNNISIKKHYIFDKRETNYILTIKDN
uniref:Cytochrome P450 n=1 Tax=Mimiviridae sp. ChoanoV1 TaxID=2596887 RepID=A0A5B8IHG5_9VIRU|nr:hypothetical protein 1_87 [Mimiviridae sp. ChoanoV1]